MKYELDEYHKGVSDEELIKDVKRVYMLKMVPLFRQTKSYLFRN